MDLRQIHREDVFDPSLGRVWMSKVKVTTDKKHAVHSRCPRQRTNGMHSLQTTSVSSGWDHSIATGEGWFQGLACSLFG